MAAPVAPATARECWLVTKSDTSIVDFDALWVGGAGNVAIVDKAGRTTTISGVLAGQILPMSGSKVMSTNTTATLIVALKY